MTIDTLDADGLALAAIQGMHRMAVERDAAISAQQAAIERLEALPIALERRLNSPSGPIAGRSR